MFIKKININKIISSLKQIEPELVDLRMGKRGMVYADIGIENLIPINIIGDGLRRVLVILCAISERQNNIILIDEIENGLHYSSLSLLWKAVFKAAHENKVQIFATTHSDECINAYAKEYADQYSDNDDIRLFRIDRKGNQHKAYIYNFKMLLDSVENDFEVR